MNGPEWIALVILAGIVAVGSLMKWILRQSLNAMDGMGQPECPATQGITGKIIARF